MTQENIELVDRALRATHARPRPDFETINELYHPDHVLLTVMTSKLGEGEVKGARGFKAWMEAGEDVMTWDGELGGVVDIGPDTVLAVSSYRFRGASSGAETEQRLWMVITVTDGEITRTEAFLDPSAALKAAVLPDRDAGRPHL